MHLYLMSMAHPFMSILTSTDNILAIKLKLTEFLLNNIIIFAANFYIEILIY